MAEEPSFTIDQATRAQRSLRSALGLGEEQFPVPAFVGMISDEIDQMRQAGHADQDIADIVADATGQQLDPADIARFYAPPEERHREREK